MNNFGLENLLNFNTRQQAMLDVVLIDIGDYEMAPKLAPIATNDHCAILLKGQLIKSTKYRKVLERKMTSARKRLVLLEVAQQSRESILSANAVNEKDEGLTSGYRDHFKHRPV